MKIAYSDSETSCLYNRGGQCIKTATSTFNPIALHSIKSILLKVMLVMAIVVGGKVAWGETVTYTITSTSTVSTSGTAPAGSSATYNSTYKDIYQLTKDNSMTLRLSNYAGYKITGITLSMRSNASKGAGNFSMVAGSTTLSSIPTAAFNTASWYNSWSTDYVNITPTMSDSNYAIQSGENVVITIAATANSIYCQSFTITYESVSSNPTHTLSSAVSPSASGTVTLGATSLASGATTTATANPANGYTFDHWSISGTGATYTNTNPSTITMGTADATVTAFFTPLPKYEVTFEYGTGHSSTTPATTSLEEAYGGAGITLPTAVPPAGCTPAYTFYGWSTLEVPNETTTAPSIVGTAGQTYHPSGNIELHAVYAVATDYKKVTENLTDWSGTYLIVYESGGKAFDGSLDALDVTSNYINVTISSNTITSTPEIDESSFVIAKSGNTYTIKSSSGYYIGQTSNDNGLATSTSYEYSNTISYNDISSSSAHLRYNSSSNQLRFRYFKSSTYTSQNAIQLYRKEAGIFNSNPSCNCPNPTLFSASSITPTSANLSWTAGNEETDWELVVSDTELANPADAEDIINVHGTPSYSATGLNSSSTYHAYLRADCGNGDYSNWVEISFSTPCAGFTVSFEAGSGSCISELTSATCEDNIVLPDATPPSCDPAFTFFGWSTTNIENETTDMPSIVGEAGDEYHPTQGITLYAVYRQISGTTTGYRLVTDLSTVTAGTYCLISPNYYAFDGTISSGHGQSTDEPFVFTDDDVAYSAPDGALELTFVSSSTGFYMYNEDYGYLYARAASSGNLAWKETADDYSYWKYNNSNWSYYNNAYLRTYNNTFRTYANNSNNVLYLAKKDEVGNIIYHSNPTCSCTAPSAPIASNISYTSVQLSWTANGSEREWDYYCSPENVAPNQLPVPTGTVTGTANTNPYTVTSLSSATTYYWWVRAACNENEHSRWISGGSFTTRSYNITATCDESLGSVSVSGYVITMSLEPCTEYATPQAYTVISGTAEVTQEGNIFTVNPSSDCEIRINLISNPHYYTVSFEAGTGFCGTSDLTEADCNAGVVLPSARAPYGCMPIYRLYGWSEAAVSTPTTDIPTIVGTAGDTYYPTSNTTLYAVYRQADATQIIRNYNFTSIDGFDSWGNSYTTHEVNYTNPTVTVTFGSACHQTTTITDQPVLKNDGNDVCVVLDDAAKKIRSASFEFTQWNSKAQEITLHYSTDGGLTYSSTGITSTNFSISSSFLPANTNAVKVTFSNTSNQIGIRSCILKLAEGSDHYASSPECECDYVSVSKNQDLQGLNDGISDADGILNFNSCHDAQLRLKAEPNDNVPSGVGITCQWTVNAHNGTTPGVYNGQNLSYTTSDVMGHDVLLVVDADNSCHEEIPIRIRVSGGLEISGESPTAGEICVGDAKQIVVGSHEVPGTIIDVENEPVLISSTQGQSETTFIPDGPLCDDGCYESTVTFADFKENTTIESAENINYIRINMEHTFIGDIQISVECPNHQSTIILQDYHNQYDPHSYVWPYYDDEDDLIALGFGTAPNRNDDNTDSHVCNSSYQPQGTPADYCWSNNISDGYTYARGYVYSEGNHVRPSNFGDAGAISYVVIPSDMDNMTQIYHPFQDFSGLVGCPLNGDWKIKVCDSFEKDNGYVFDWEISLKNIDENVWSYDVNLVDSHLGTCDGSGTDPSSLVYEIPNSSNFYIHPTEANVEANNVVMGETRECNLTLVDNIGCESAGNGFSYTVTKPVNPSVAPQTICPDETATLTIDESAYGTVATPVTYSWTNTDGNLSATDLQEVTSSPSASVTYTVTVTDQNGCSGSAPAVVTMNNIEGIASDYDYIWKGGATGNETNWNTSANWYIYDNDEYSLATTTLPDETKNVYIGTYNCTRNTSPEIADNAGVKDITIASGLLTVPSGTTLNIGGNLTNTTGTLDATEGTLVFCGTAQRGENQTISGDIALGNVTFNNLGGNIVPEGSMTIAGEAKFSKGIVKGNVSLGESASVYDPDALTHNSFVDGTVTKTMTSSGEFTFPTGSGEVLGTVKATIPSGSTDVTFYHVSGEGFDMPDADFCDGNATTFDHISAHEYWKVNTSSDLTADLKVSAAESSAHFTEGSTTFLGSDIYAVILQGGCWNEKGGTAEVSEPNHETITISGVAIPAVSSRAIQPLTLASTTSTTLLPIELTSFAATCDGSSAAVSWTTATERNNDYFSLERSADAINFNEIARIAGAGNSIEPLSYSYTDYGIIGGDNYYRLVQVDYDGTRTASEIIVANCSGDNDGNPEVLAYPNPFAHELNLVLQNFGNRQSHIEVYDMLGKIVKSIDIDSPQNDYEMVLHLDDIPSAAYSIRVSTADFVINKNVVKR